MGPDDRRSSRLPQGPYWCVPPSMPLRISLPTPSAGAVKALQVESSVCVTGGVDGQIRIWDLDLAESTFPPPLSSPSLDATGPSMENVLLGKSEDVFGGGAGLVNGNDEGMMREEEGAAKAAAGPCVRTLDGHTKAVTSLYFDGSCLVRPRFALPPSLPFLLSATASQLTPRAGDWLLRPNSPPMGPPNRSMRPDDGHPLGHLEPARLPNPLLGAGDRELRRPIRLALLSAQVSRRSPPAKQQLHARRKRGVPEQSYDDDVRRWELGDV